MALLPEDKIEVTTLIRNMMAEVTHSIDNKPKDTWDAEMRKEVQTRLGIINAQEAAKLLRNELESIAGDALSQVRAAKEFMELMHKKTSPVQIVLENNKLHKKIIDVENQIKKMAVDFDKHFTSKFIEEVSNNSLRDLYLQSGLGLKHIEDEFKCGTTCAHKYAHGDVVDLKIRSRLKSIYLKAIEEHVTI